jgi:hypothetical protein
MKYIFAFFMIGNAAHAMEGINGDWLAREAAKWPEPTAADLKGDCNLELRTAEQRLAHRRVINTEMARRAFNNIREFVSRDYSYGMRPTQEAIDIQLRVFKDSLNMVTMDQREVELGRLIEALAMPVPNADRQIQYRFLSCLLVTTDPWSTNRSFWQYSVAVNIWKILHSEGLVGPDDALIERLIETIND